MADSAAVNGEADKTSSKVTAQLKKLQEANSKYKNLLKLAKERIQQQEEELETVRHEKLALEERLVSDEREAAKEISLEETSDRGALDEISNIARVCQRVKSAVGECQNGLEEIWALLEMEVVPVNEMTDATVKRFKVWKRFDTESELQDFIRRDTGEPLTLPPYSLSPDQSARIEQEAAARVSQVTEEFRRFRVRAELSRKQSDAQIRDLQNSKCQSAARRIEGNDLQHELEQARSVGGQVERMKAELAAQEAQWKEAYDILLAENTALKSSGSEALLASQWRKRYEACLTEKEDLEARLNDANAKADSSDAGKYEAKYRDLKESFRLYRKKAKEMFEAQERGAVVSPSQAKTLDITDSSSADAKLSYLRNLMVNYLTSEPAVREHMESAIGTVLKFSPEDVERIEKRKADNEAWF